MKIVSSQVSLSAVSEKTAEVKHTESLSYWDNRKSIKNGSGSSTQQRDSIEISSQAKSMLAASKTQGTGDVPSATEDDNDLKARLLEEFIYQMTGKRYHINVAKLNLNQSGSSAEPVASTQQSQPAQQSATVPKGWGLKYHSEDQFTESEKMNFTGAAVVNTADGRQINVNLNINFSREFLQSSTVDIKAGDALIDPLVINLDGSGDVLSDKTFSFDIDMDGKFENIAAPSSGSGFLALDNNGNGKIDDGSELLGPSTDNGFSELAALDSDKNGWIDENDTAFSQLRIMSVDDNGNSTLFTLADKGVGAIYAGGASADFSFKDASNTTTGEVKQMGMFLFENGGGGAVGELDLAV
jgi:hypothetical protein